MRPESDDVDALLAEANAFYVFPTSIATRLAAALRAERARAMSAEREQHADTARVLGEVAGAHMNTAFALDTVRNHLRAVLAHGWPDGTTGPACVRAARAFLAGEEQAQEGPPTCASCDRALDAYQREIDLLRKDLAEKGAALVRMRELHEPLVNDIGAAMKAISERASLREHVTAGESIAVVVPRLIDMWEAALGALIRADDAKVAALLEDAGRYWRSLPVARDPHAIMSGMLGLVQGLRRDLANEQFRTERAREEMRKALVAQNVAESERDEARRRVYELEAALRGLVALVPAKGGA